MRCSRILNVHYIVIEIPYIGYRLIDNDNETFISIDLIPVLHDLFN